MKLRYIKQQIDTFGLVAYYKLWASPTSASEVFDYSLGGFAGTLTGTDIVPAYPGFRMNGTDDFIDVTASGPSSVKTVLAWVNPDSVAGADAVIDLNGTDALALVTGALAILGGFASGTLYVDGVTGTTVTANWHLVGVTVSASKNANALTLGKATIFLGGLMGETLLYDRVLSAAEIKSVYELTRWRYSV